MKKILVDIVVLSLVLTTCLPTFALAGPIEYEGKFGYQIHNDQAYIVSIDHYTSGNVVIPSTLGGKPVSQIREYAFYERDRITSVTIPQGVKEIHHDAFSNCISLKTVKMADSVAVLHDSVFSGCTALEKIELSSGIESLSRGMFSNCVSLKEIDISEGIQGIEERAFENCSSLRTITLPASMQNVSGAAFNGCDMLEKIEVVPKSEYYTAKDGMLLSKNMEELCAILDNKITEEVVIPSYVKKIGSSVFSGKEIIKSVKMHDDITEIGNSAFCCCRGLENVTLPKNLKILGDGSFSGCSNLKSIEFPKKLTTIKISAFAECTGLTSLNITKNLVDVDSQAFYGCINIRKISVEEGNKSFVFTNGGVFNTDGTILYFVDGEDLTSYTIPQGVKTITFKAFNHCTELETLKMPISLKEISTEAFDGCKKLKEVYYEGGEVERDKLCKNLYWYMRKDKVNSPVWEANWHFNDYPKENPVVLENAPATRETTTSSVWIIVVCALLGAAGVTAIVLKFILKKKE